MTTTTYYSSDWHLGHPRIIDFCDRPYRDVHHMNQDILARCNDTVGVTDSLVLLGDHCLGKYSETIELLRQIKCRNVTLFPGNHDRWSLAYRQSKPEKRALAIEELRRMGFAVVEDHKPSQWRQMLSNGTSVELSHYPYEGDSGDKDRHVDFRPVDQGLPLVHGHVHTRWQTRGRMMNVGVDMWDFTPVSEEQVMVWVATLPMT